MIIRTAILLLALFSAALLVPPAVSMSQTAQDNAGSEHSGSIPGDILPGNAAAPGPVANVDVHQHKFDDGFYDKIRNLITEEPQPGDPGVYDGTRYYNVIIVVSRDDGDARDPDETAKENKDAIVKRLTTAGARDITPAGSLSFVTASIPVADIPGFSLHDEAYRLGDGELPVVSEVDTARQTIRATPDDVRTAVGRSINGSGIVVGVLDTGINHGTAFGERILEHAACDNTGCRQSTAGHAVGTESPYHSTTSHGTRVAQVLAASGLPEHNGIAPGVELLDIKIGRSAAGLAHGLDHALRNGADVINISGGLPSSNHNAVCDVLDNRTTYDLITDEAVDKGMVAVKSAGNEGSSSNRTAYESITNPGCGSNIITVGGIDDRDPNTTTMYRDSSRGPAGGTVILKPEIAAPATNINLLSFISNSTYYHDNGTSYAAPQVSATAAMMLQLKPDLTPVEIKAALLLGADWQGPVPCTSSQYERSSPSDNCSHARQPTGTDEATEAASVALLNNVGFGILDTSQSLKYVSQRTPSHNHVMGGHLDGQTTSRQYSFEVTDASDPAKVILTWMAHPHGSITDQASRSQAVGAANLDFVVTAPDESTIRAESAHQTNEFAVFSTSVGNYTITVTGSGLDSINKPVQNYAIASTHSLSPLPAPFTNAAPTAQPRTVIIDPDMTDPAIIRLHGADRDGDPLSFSVSDDPDHGTVTTDEFITNTISRMLYTPDSTFRTTDTFAVTPQDGLATGTPATITINAESPPPGSTDVSPSSSDIRDWDTLLVDSGFAHTGHSKAFPGPSYSVSALHVGSVNMEGADLTITASDGGTYTVAVPASGTRMMELSSPITIRSATLSADGIDEAVVHQATSASPVIEDVRMFVGYVPNSCSASGAQGASSGTCPAQLTSDVTILSGAAIPDDTDSQDTSSTHTVSASGTLSSLSVYVDIEHTYIGDLKVVLTPPGGTAITLHDRSGGSTHDLAETYTSASNTDLGGLAGSQITGRWTLSVGDYSGADVGTLNEWTLSMTYRPDSTTTPQPPPTTQTPVIVFSDSFESSSLTANWIETGDGDWRTSTSQSQSVPTRPGQSASNLVLHSDNCDIMCTLTLRDSIDLTGYSSATLSFWRFVDSGLDRDEYLKVEAYDGSAWNTIYHWSHNLGGDDSTWHQESYDLASYLDADDFKIRLVTQQSSSSEDVQLDDIAISASSGGSTVQPPPRPVTISEDFESGLDGWTQGGDSDWITRSPTTPLPGSQTGNTVAYSSNCDTLCTITLSPADLSSRQTGHLTLDRFVSSALDGGEYLRVELHDGSAWTTAFDWQASSGDDDSTWHTESYDLSSGHLVSEMQVRITARSSSSSEIAMIDNISISDSGSSSPPTSGHSIYVADTDDREVLVFSESGTYLGDFVEDRAGGLGKAWDVAFGPDGHLYISDNTYSKIRKYNGATGAPISGSSAGWASTTGYPYGLTWNGNTLYVATSMGVERFSSSGSSLGYFGDASRNPASSGATALLSPYDIVFCADGRMYAADRSLGKILYYRASDGTYQGAISGTSSSPPNTYRAAGLECGGAMSGNGSSLYQGGDDAGRVNEINPTDGSSLATITSLIDEPYGMDMDDAGVLYVANKDDDNVISISSGTASVFVSGNRMDDPRGVTVGPVYSAAASGDEDGTSGRDQPEDAGAQDNDEPEFVLTYNGTVTGGPIRLAQQQISLGISATDPEGDTITIRAIPDTLLPQGAVSITDRLNGTATMTVNTAGVTAGTYAVWVEVSDVHGNYGREPYAVIVP